MRAFRFRAPGLFFPQTAAALQTRTDKEYFFMSRQSHDAACLLTAGFFYFSAPMLTTPIITGFSGSLGAGSALMGAIGGLMNFTALLCRPLAGNLADRVSRFRTTMIGVAFMTIACIGYVAAPDPLTIALARVANGVGFAFCSIALSTWMADLLPPEKLASGMGVYGMMNALGMAVAPAIGVIVCQRSGYRAALSVALFFSILTGIIVLFVRNRGLPSPKQSLEKGSPLRLCDRNAIPLAVITALFAISYCATQSFLLEVIEKKEIDASPELFFPTYAVALLALRFGLKNRFDRTSFRFFLAASAISSFLGVLLLATMRSNLQMLAAAVFLAGGYGVMTTVCQSWAMLLAGKGRRALANGTYYIGLDLGMTLGPAFGGLILSECGVALFYPLLAICIPFALVAYVLAGNLRRAGRFGSAEWTRRASRKEPRKETCDGD